MPQISSALGIVSLAQTVGEIFIFIVIFGAFATFFIVAIGNRTDEDPVGSRPMAAYLFSGAFLFLWIAYLGIDVAANSLINLAGSHPGPTTISPIGIFTTSLTSYRNDAIRACVLGGLLVVFAGGAFVLHLRRGNSLADLERDLSGPTKRVMRSYVALVSFLSMLILIIALVAAGWLVAGLISPTIFLASSQRTETVRSILQALVLVVLAGGIFSYHQRFAPESLRLLGSVSGGGGRHVATSHDRDAELPTTTE